MRSQIIAIGGASFNLDPRGPLDRYLLAQVRAKTPAICLLPTARGDDQEYIDAFYAAFGKLPCKPSHVELFDRTPDLEKALLGQDIIFVGGGNTKSMLAVWREWGVPEILKRAWRRGIVLAGVSAGAICWFDYGVTDSWAGDLRPLRGLGWLKDACCPHYDGETDRRPAVHRLVASRAIPATLALDDGAAAHFVGRRLARIVASRETAGGYHVEREHRGSIETALPVLQLSARGKVTR